MKQQILTDSDHEEWLFENRPAMWAMLGHTKKEREERLKDLEKNDRTVS